MNIHDFQKMKQTGNKISMITCYDFCSAKIVAQTDIDCVLVGDSVAMVMHGHETTIPATVDLMALHIKAVAKGAPNKFIIGDMPFLSCRKGLLATMDAVQQIIQAGAQAIKLEGVTGNEEMIAHIVASGIPVMGHVGLTMQTIHQLGGARAQGKDAKTAELLMQQALTLEKLGCFAVVLECMPNSLAQTITEKLRIPTIGIGAGAVDGQVLVLQDMLGLNVGFKPKFLKTYFNGFDEFLSAINNYHRDVKNKMFPVEEHYY